MKYTGGDGAEVAWFSVELFDHQTCGKLSAISGFFRIKSSRQDCYFMTINFDFLNMQSILLTMIPPTHNFFWWDNQMNTVHLNYWLSGLWVNWLGMYCKVEKIGSTRWALVQITINSDELCSVDMAPIWVHFTRSYFYFNRIFRFMIDKKLRIGPWWPDGRGSRFVHWIIGKKKHWWTAPAAKRSFYQLYPPTISPFSAVGHDRGS